MVALGEAIWASHLQQGNALSLAACNERLPTAGLNDGEEAPKTSEMTSRPAKNRRPPKMINSHQVITGKRSQEYLVYRRQRSCLLLVIGVKASWLMEKDEQ